MLHKDQLKNPTPETLEECEEFLRLRKIPADYRTAEEQERYTRLIVKLTGLCDCCSD